MLINFRLSKLFGIVLLCSIVFQSVGVLPNADTQPNFVVLSLLFMLVCVGHLKYENISFLIFVGSYMFLLVAFIFQSEYILLKYFLTYTVSVVSFFTLFVLVKNKVLHPTSNFILSVTSIYAFVGVVQFFIPDFLSFLVTRSVDAALSFSETGRGRRSLTGEPAHLGKVFIILNVLFLFDMCISKKSIFKPNQLIVVSVLFLLVNTLISQSFYAIFFHASILAILIFFVDKIMFTYLSVVLATFLGFFISFINDLSSDIRFVNILTLIINTPSELLNQGAIRRVFNVPLSLNNLKYFEWYGSGSDPKTFVAALNTPLGVLHYSGLNRAYGGVIEFALKFGALSIPLFITYFFLLFRISAVRIKFKEKNINIGLFFALSIFILTFQEGALAKPLPMFLLIYIYINRSCLRN
jgi:hypothetical protein